MVSVILPSRNERFLVPTVQDVLAKARGEVEVIAVLDGYWPDPPLPEDSRLVVLHHGESKGMRTAINVAAQIARGQHLMKLDAHCSVSEGFDVTLAADCDVDWVVIPRRDRLDPLAWGRQETGKPPIDHHYLNWPGDKPDDPFCGLHGSIWPARSRAMVDVRIDDEMTTQGSCWFTPREYFLRRFYPLDQANYGNITHEAQEITLKAWLSGGQVKVNKGAQYLHLHKGKTYGRGYPLGGSEHGRSTSYCTDYWMHDRCPEAVHPLRWLVEKFAPVPTWPADLDEAFRFVRERLAVACR